MYVSGIITRCQTLTGLGLHLVGVPRPFNVWLHTSTGQCPTGGRESIAVNGEDDTNRCPFKKAHSGRTSSSHLVCFRHPGHNAAPSLGICCVRPCNFFCTSSLVKISSNPGPSAFLFILFPTCRESRSKWIVTDMPTIGTVGRLASNTQHTTAVLVCLSPPCTVDPLCVANKSSRSLQYFAVSTQGSSKPKHAPRYHCRRPFSIRTSWPGSIPLSPQVDS